MRHKIVLLNLKTDKLHFFVWFFHITLKIVAYRKVSTFSDEFNFKCAFWGEKLHSLIEFTLFGSRILFSVLPSQYLYILLFPYMDSLVTIVFFPLIFQHLQKTNFCKGKGKVQVKFSKPFLPFLTAI